MSVMILVLARITAELPVGTAIEYRPAFKAGFDTCKVFINLYSAIAFLFCGQYVEYFSHNIEKVTSLTN